jgi:hypothetical protein
MGPILANREAAGIDIGAEEVRHTWSLGEQDDKAEWRETNAP